MSTADDETRLILRRNWSCALGEIADLELQRRTWLDPTNTDNPHWSYIEFVCSYPDSEQLAEGLKRGYLSHREAQILTDFFYVLTGYKHPEADDYDNKAVLNDPAWHEVVKAAQKAKADLSLA